MASAPEIQAAGVVVLRSSWSASGQEVLVVHRPGRSDWSLPKGKVDSGEHVIAAAVRECDEETGFTPTLLSPLAAQHYLANGRPKSVHYWRAKVRSEEGFTPDDEVDEIRWVAVDEAPALLTYPSDIDLVASAIAMPDTTPLVIVRHTKALKRSDYGGEADIDRPLTGKGRTQSKALVPVLDAFGPMRIHTSAARRCFETVRRLAKQQGTEAIRENAITEEGHHIKPKAAARRARELALDPEPILICSHRPVLPTIFDAVADALGVDVDDPAWDTRLSPGSFIVIHRHATPKGRLRAVAIERHDIA